MNEEKGGNYDYDKQNIFICHATCRHDFIWFIFPKANRFEKFVEDNIKDYCCKLVLI